MRGTLLSVTVFVAVAAPAVAGTCANARQIYYEPQVIEVSGKTFVARARHPNGTLMKYPVMRLANAVSITADGVNSINAEEPCVGEVQLMGATESIRKKLFGANGRKLSVRGTVFHSHTAWHMRPLVVVVQGVSNEP